MVLIEHGEWVVEREGFIKRWHRSSRKVNLLCQLRFVFSEIQHI